MCIRDSLRAGFHTQSQLHELCCRGRAIEACDFDAVVGEARLLAGGYSLKAKLRVGQLEPHMIGIPLAGTFRSEKFAVMSGRPLDIRHRHHDVVDTDGAVSYTHLRAHE